MRAVAHLVRRPAFARGLRPHAACILRTQMHSYGFRRSQLTLARMLLAVLTPVIRLPSWQVSRSGPSSGTVLNLQRGHGACACGVSCTHAAQEHWASLLVTHGPHGARMGSRHCARAVCKRAHPRLPGRERRCVQLVVAERSLPRRESAHAHRVPQGDAERCTHTPHQRQAGHVEAGSDGSVSKCQICVLTAAVRQ